MAGGDKQKAIDETVANCLFPGNSARVNLSHIINILSFQVLDHRGLCTCIMHLQPE